MLLQVTRSEVGFDDCREEEQSIVNTEYNDKSIH